MGGIPHFLIPRFMRFLAYSRGPCQVSPMPNSSRSSGPEPTRTVLIADDHQVVREGLIEILSSIPNTTLVDEAENGLEAIGATKRHKPDLLILDAAMPLANGIEVLADTQRWSPETRVVLFTGFTAARLMSEWLQAGVDGILLKSCSKDEIKLGLETVFSGGRYIAKDAEMRLVETSETEALTAREREVLSLVATGHRSTAIAERLHISEKTVEKHRGSLLRKLNVNSVAELMAYALREGLLDQYTQSCSSHSNV